jgi:hypothetical protein
VFEVRSDRDSDEIRPTPELVSYRVSGTRQYGTGERYRIPPRVYHRTALVDRWLAVTVMLSENWTPEPQRVLGDVDLPPHTVTRRTCTPAETVTVVEMLLRSLEE